MPIIYKKHTRDLCVERKNVTHSVVYSYAMDRKIGLSTGTANLNHEISLERTQKNYIYTGKHTRIYVEHGQQNNTQKTGFNC